MQNYTDGHIQHKTNNISVDFYYPGSNVTVNVMHPGVVNSGAHRHMGFKQSTLIKYTFAPLIWYFMKTPLDGAQTQVYLAVAKEEEGVSGKYYGYVVDWKLYSIYGIRSGKRSRKLQFDKRCQNDLHLTYFYFSHNF